MRPASRLLVLTSSYPQAPDDYRGGFVREWVKEMATRGFPATVVFPEADRGEPVALRDVTHRALRYWPRRRGQTLFHGAGVLQNLQSRPWEALKLPGFLAAALLAGLDRHSLIVSHWLLPMGLYGSWLANCWNVPHLVVVHSGGLAMLEQLPFGAALAGWIAENSARLVFVGSHLQRRFRQLTPVPESRCAVIPMGVAIPRQGPLPTPDAAGPLKLLFLGRLAPIKGLDILLDALRPDDPVTLTVVGDGKLGATLKRTARERSLPVTFWPSIGTDRRQALFAEAHALVVPSVPLASGRTEGAPRVILEAMACGLPVIGSDSGAIAELVGDGGIIVPAGDRSRLRQAIIELAGAPSSRKQMSLAARQRARTFEWRVVGDRFSALLHDLTAK